jgi:hypothetical protein
VNSAPTSKRLVLGEFIVLCVSYAIGLWVVVITFAGRLPAGQLASLLVGLGVFIAAYVVLFWLLSRRLPWVIGGRPWRYSIPRGITVAGALWWSATPLDLFTPAVATYAVVIPLLIVGQVLSSLWWSTASPAGVPHE